MNKILIANRGEIACRIARTCRRLGIKTVAVYSDADSRAMHIGACDEAIHIGAAETKRSYLNIDAVISAAKKCRADAVHPGYGFLSENPAFVEALDKESITFIGPSAEAMRALGDKLKAKALAKKLKIPVSPSVQAEFSDSRSLKHLEQQAAKIGFPLLIKAAGGGGGRGMRKIESAAQLGDALKSASREAQAFFGDATIFLEKYIKQARHIEVQVIGDQHGNVFDLLDRDCSSQRNHQKVIEEAPAPNISAKTRSAMYTAARKLAKQAKYAGAATVEFLLDAQQNFYFLEVNSRLQVEHPVTEEILGIDLVELQIEAAKGANLKKIFPFRGGKTLKPKGSAIECRLCAEKPVQGFIASTGKIHALDLQAPCSPAKLRFDCGFRSGDRISHHYDSLLGKIILHAKSRDGARLAALEVLRSSNIVGIETNSAFLEAILASADFAQGNPHLALVPSLLDRIGQEAAHRKLACALHMVAASLPQGRAGGDPWSS
ncbi:MAG: methylcrotonoyl-CoA carboxylase, partial [Proteobacteria bacterium]